MPLVEIHPRKFSHRFGAAPRMERIFLDTPDIQASAEVLPVIGSDHPDNAGMKLVSIDKTTNHNNDPEQIQYILAYEPIAGGRSDPDPLSRDDEWAITIGNAIVPCTNDKDGNAIVNSNNTLIQGLKRREAQLRMQIAGNREYFPIDTHKAVVNKINNAAWAEGAKHTWLCVGGSAEQETELVDGIPVDYWRITFEFLYRSQDWSMTVADVGWTYKDGADRRRGYVKDPSGKYIQSPEPLALHTDGSLKTTDADGTTIATPGWTTPNLLHFDIYDEIDFSNYFGDPPETTATDAS